MATDPDQVICDNLEKPKKGQNNMGMFEQHSLKDQIEVSQHLQANKIGTPGYDKTLGMLVRVFNMPGTV